MDDLTNRYSIDKVYIDDNLTNRYSIDKVYIDDNITNLYSIDTVYIYGSEMSEEMRQKSKKHA